LDFGSTAGDREVKSPNWGKKLKGKKEKKMWIGYKRYLRNGKKKTFVVGISRNTKNMGGGGGDF